MGSVLRGIFHTTLAAMRPIYARPDEAIVIPPANVGSAGDQAMLDAISTRLIENHAMRVSVLHVHKTEGRIPLRNAHDYLQTSIRTPVDRLGRMIAVRRPGAMVALGADIIDGVYGPRLELKKLEMLATAASAGARTAVVGCSISTTPSKDVIDAIKKYKSLNFYLRDEISLSRFETFTGRKGVLVSDVAFLLKPQISNESGRNAAAFIADQKVKGRTILAVNASGHTLEKAPTGTLQALGAAMKAWLAADSRRAVLIVPHDTRPAPTGDMEAGEALLGAAGEVDAERAHLLAAPFTAWDIKALMGEVDMLLTGRMHLAIAALGMGTPPLCVVYQGKYEGLMRHFGLDDQNLLMEPTEASDADRVHDRINDLTARLSAVKGKIKDRLPAVMDLSRRNFEWLSDNH